MLGKSFYTKRLSIFLFIFIALAMVANSLFVIFYSDSLLSDKAEGSVKRLAVEENEHIQSYFDSIVSMSRLLSLDIMVERALVDGVNETASSTPLSNALNRSKIFLNESDFGIGVLDSSGSVRAAIGEFPVNDLHQGYIKKIRDNRNLFVYELENQNASNSSTLLLSSPLIAESGRIFGYMVLRTPADQLSEILKQDYSSNSEDDSVAYQFNAYIYRNDGSLLAKAQSGDVDNVLPSANTVAEFIAGCRSQSEQLKSYTINGVEHFGASKCLLNGWVLVAEEQLTPFISTLSSIRNGFLFSSAVFIFLALIPFYFFIKHSSGRYKELSEAIKKISEGNFRDLSKDGSYDEIGGSALAIGEMVASLRNSQVSLENKSKLLADEMQKIELQNKELADTKRAMLNLLEDSRFFEENVKKERGQLQTILTSIAEGLMVLDNQFKVILVNNAAAQLLGFSELELKGKDYRSLFSLVRKGELLVEEANVVHKTMKSGKSHVVDLEDEVVCRTIYNREFPVNISTTPLIAEDGTTIAGEILVFRDITERKRLSKELEDKLNELEKFQELTIGREFKMIELKKEIEKLRNQLVLLKNNSRD